jgi:hypothetical protein
VKRIAVLLVTGLALSVTAPALASSEGNYRDDFKNPVYTGNDGSLSWNGPWQEIGEGDGPSTGAVHVMSDGRCAGNKCLHIHSGGQVLAEVGAMRFADTSLFTGAELCYELNSVILDMELGDTNLYVEVTKNGGSNWTTVDTLSVLELFDAEKKRTISIDGYLSEGFGVRFVVNGLLDGEVFVDNVEVWGVLKQETTTTTSTTSTTTPTTTTTKPTTTSTTAPDRPTTTDRSGVVPPVVDTTSTSTTTTIDRSGDEDPSGAVASEPAPPSDGEGGLNFSKMGVQTDFGGTPFQNEGMAAPEVLGLTVEYAMAVEVIAANWIWPVVLVLLITVLLVVGLDRRRRLPRLV